MEPRSSWPIVAIIGRPNVGKSTLFNRIARGRKAVVHDEAGVTRDRHAERAEWNGRPFWIVDTGGVQLAPHDELSRAVQAQVDAAIEEADVILFMLDAQTGLTVEDEAIVKRLSRAAKPVIPVANKADDDLAAAAVHEIRAGGLGPAFPISARRGRGLDELLDTLAARLPEVPAGEGAEDPDVIRVAIVGRPNVGKSSIVNAITGTHTMVVSEVPGTTRDAVDTPLLAGGARFLLVDTAGLRRRARTTDPLDVWASLRSMRAIERADVAALVVDATAGILDQDVWIAAEAVREGKSVLVVVNKWDAVEKDPEVALRFEDRFRFHFKFLPDAPILYVSAKSKRRIEKILAEAKKLAAIRAKRVEGEQLNEVVRAIFEENPPPASASRRPIRFFSAAQLDVLPPTFTIVTNDPAALEGHYERFLRNQLRDRLELRGSPVRVLLRKRGGAKGRDRSREEELP
jgi:GTP-binding protein